MEQAPPPAFMRQVIRQQNNPPEVEPGKDRDKILASLSESEAWATLKKFIQNKQLMLAKQLKESIDNASLEEIGFRFLVTDQINNFANQLITFVEAPEKVYGLKREQALRERGRDQENSAKG